jgi:hypothetical protein
VVGLAQLLGRGDAERAHEVLHVEPVARRVRATFFGHLLAPGLCFEHKPDAITD